MAIRTHIGAKTGEARLAEKDLPKADEPLSWGRKREMQQGGRRGSTGGGG